MKRVNLESPMRSCEHWQGYLKLCMQDSISRGEAPFASHAMYPFFLNDDRTEERELGIEMGMEYLVKAQAVVFYVDHGMSPGMLVALDRALEYKKRVEFRCIMEDKFAEDFYRNVFNQMKALYHPKAEQAVLEEVEGND